MTEQQAEAFARGMLADKRFAHSKQVAEMAAELARSNGANVHKASTAGWLHDVLKEKSAKDLLQMAQEAGIPASELEQHPQATWHGIVASAWLKSEHEICDAEILSAIACHTVGKVGMSLLDKILYVADAVSAGRKYAGVGALRETALQNLDEGALAIMRHTVAYLQEHNLPKDPSTEKAMEELSKNILQKRQAEV